MWKCLITVEAVEMGPVQDGFRRLNMMCTVVDVADEVVVMVLGNTVKHGSCKRRVGEWFLKGGKTVDGSVI